MSNAASVRPSRPSFCKFDRAEAMHKALAQEIASRLTAAVTRSGQASMVVSGGTTPGPTFDTLARSDVPWQNVDVTMTDDRWIDAGSDRSNERLIRSRLLAANAAAARFVPLKTAHAHAHEAEDPVGNAVRAMHRPFDVVVLGMGVDGHVASLIPGAKGLARAMDVSDPALVRAIEPANLADMGERMTLTLRALQDSHWIVLLIRGSAKLKAYEHALMDSDVLAMPARAILQQTNVPTSVYWSP
ncbi:MAG TPA: 6-phosphogluconolactonase [Rhizomicrobium sp.]|nr:6-phosphogluconolactonase [Rhizomicrobium sp.]